MADRKPAQAKASSPAKGGKAKDARWIDIREGEFDEAQLKKWIQQARALPGWGNA